MLFSEKFNIEIRGNESWFDPILDNDTKLFIDPMLVFQNNLSDFKNSRKKITNFFQEAFEKVAKAKGHINGKKFDAIQMLQFKEVKETLIGYSNYGSKGSGMGEVFSEKIFHAIIDLMELGVEDLGSYLSTFEMFVEGIGRDRISDMISNILKEELIKYTQEVCKDYSIPMKKFMITNYCYDSKLGWISKKVDLPENPYEKNRAIILIPKEFLRANSSIDVKDLEMYLSRIENTELRRQATRLFTLDLNRAKLREAAKKEPSTVKQVLELYFRNKEKEKNIPYDLKNDPDLLYWFHEKLNEIKKDLPKIETEQNNLISLKNFVEGILKQFKHVIEGREGYKLLFNDNDHPKEEKASQILFWGIADTMCNLNGKIVICREGLTGRGPVDFKFSEGYNNKIHVEIKLAKNSSLYTSLENQLTTYMKSDNVELGYYVVIKLLGGDNARSVRLQDRYEKIEETIRKKINLWIIDAYPGSKDSASKFKR